jgi:uncharacterized protein (DUF2062 family)
MKGFLKRYIPSKAAIKNHPSMHRLRHFLDREYLWKYNRTSVARAVAIGLFFAFIPLPVQMLLAGICAIYFNANLPISLVVVWLTNPITMPAIFYFCYRVGSWLLEDPIMYNKQTLKEAFMTMWHPFFLGCFVMSVTCSMLGYLVVMLFWRLFRSAAKKV